MRSRLIVFILFFVVVLVLPTDGARFSTLAIPPGRQYRMTIEGGNTITFIPQAGLPQFQVDYQARIEYIVDTRFGKEPKASTDMDPIEEVDDEKPVVKPTKAATSKATTTNTTKGKTSKKAENPAQKVSGAVDLSLHSSEMTLRQGGQAVLETKVSRTKFQGRLQPDTPVMSVTAKDAPPRLQEILKTFDVVTATLAINEDDKVIGRKFRFEGPHRAVTETILSIHAPIPKGQDTWEAPTQLAMGHGQTAKGTLRFEKVKPTVTRKDESAKPVEDRKDETIKVKVSGVLKAEGAIAGRFIKDGTYTVTGEQFYDMHTKEWVSSKWSVVVANDLANPNGQTVAHAQGTMTVESRAVVASPSGSDPNSPKF